MEKQLVSLKSQRKKLQSQLDIISEKIDQIEDQMNADRFETNRLEPLDGLMVIQEFLDLSHIIKENKNSPFTYVNGQTVKIFSIRSNGMCNIRSDGNMGLYNIGIGQIPIDVVCKMRSAYLCGGEYEKWRVEQYG